MNNTMTLSRGSSILAGTFFIGMLLTFAFTVSMGWLLTPAGYGMLGVAQAFLGLTGLFTGSAFPWVVAKFMAEPDRQDKPAIFKSSLLANICLAALLCLLLYLSYELRWLPLDNTYQQLIIVVLIYIVLVSFAGVYQGALQGLLRFKELGIIRCAQPVVLLISSIVLVLHGLGTSGAMTGFAIGALVSLVFLIYYTRDQRLWKGSSWVNKEVYTFALPIFLGVMGAQFLMNVDILGVKFFIPGMSDTMAGYYRASLAISRMPVFFIITIMGAFLPFISYHASNRKMVINYSARMVKYVLIFIFPLCLAIFAIPESLLTLIFPESYIVGAPALRILSIGMFLLALSYIYASVFQGVGKPKVPALIMLGAIAIQIVCLYLLVPRYGLTGAAVSTTSACSMAFILLQYMHAKHFGFGFIVTDLGKIVLASITLFPVLYFFPTPGRALTVVGLVCGLGVFFVILVVTRVLHHTDADILLSGLLDEENRFRSKAVSLVRILNREATN